MSDSNFFNIDITDCEKVRRIFDLVKPNWVIHLAALHYIPFCNQNPTLTCDVNISGTKNVLTACSNCDSLEKVFFSSTAAVYPISNFPHTENDFIGPLDIYGISKMAGECLFNEFHINTRIPTIICRFFNAFGPNETNPHLIPAIQNQLLLGKRVIQLGNLEPKRDFIHTTDMARAVRLLLDKFSSGIDVFNLGQGIEYSVLQIVDSFRLLIKENIEIEIDPARVRKVDRMHLVADISKIKSFIDWEPKMSIIDGLSTLI